MEINVAKSIEFVPTASLKPYERNSRTHSEAQIAQIAASIREYGFTNPILVDRKKDGIIAGHGRLEAAKKLGLETVPVIVLDHLSDAQRRAYIIADNKLALNAGWNAEILQEELADLNDLDFDLSSIGFSDDELEAILGAEDPDDVIATAPAPTLRKQLEEQAAESSSASDEEESDEGEEQEDPYTKKIEAPVYEPKGEKPDLSDLVDAEKTKGLVSEIEDADIPEEVKSFLRLAAQRHLTFDYGKVAEYYAQAPAEVQDLMERSALVIIDFDKAIENGFVQMTKEIAEAYPSDDEQASE